MFVADLLRTTCSSGRVGVCANVVEAHALLWLASKTSRLPRLAKAIDVAHST